MSPGAGARARIASRACGAVSLLAGVAAFAAAAIRPGPPVLSMSIGASSAVALLGAAMLLVRSSDPAHVRARRVLALLAGASAVATFVRVAVSIGRPELAAPTLVDRLLMSPGAAVVVLLLAAVLGTRRGVPIGRVRRALTGGAAIACLLAITGFLHGALGLQGIGADRPLALSAALALLVLSAGILLASPDEGVVGTLLDPGPGGAIARRLLPFALLLPIALDALRHQLVLSRYTPAPSGAAAASIATGVALAALVLWTARRARAANLELRAAQDEFVREADQRRLILDNTVEAVITMAEDGRIVGWNARAEAIFGWKAAEVVGLSLADTLIPADHREAHARGLARFLATGQGPILDRGIEVTAVARDGREIPIELTVRVLTLGTGRFFTGFARDLTQARAADAARAELLSAIEASDDAIVTESPDGVIRSWNSGARSIFGYEAQEVLGRSSTLLLPSRQVADEAAFVDGILRGGASARRETLAARKDGAIIHVAVTASPVRDRSGKIIAITRVVRDITERVHAQEALERHQARLRRIVESGVIGIVMGRTEGKLLDANETFLRMIGRDRRDLEAGGLDWRGLTAPEDRARDDRALAELRERGACTPYRKHYVAADGSRVPVLQGAALFDDPGEAVAFVVDMTAQEAAERALRESTERLRERSLELAQKNEEVEAFVYAVSHDLRAPLVNIQGFAEELAMGLAELRREVLPEPEGKAPRDAPARVTELLLSELPGALQYITASTDRFDRLIRSLLTLSRTGRQEYAVGRVDLEDVARRTVDSLRHLADERQAEIRIGPIPPVAADPTAASQVMGNLLSNAIKYAHPGRRLEVDVTGRVEEHAVHVRIRDNGLGMPPVASERLFEAFRRFHPEAAPGDGMGLAIVKRIVERHGGRIWAESSEGRGTTFHFTLPAASGERVQAP